MKEKKIKIESWDSNRSASFQNSQNLSDNKNQLKKAEYSSVPTTTMHQFSNGVPNENRFIALHTPSNAG